MRVLIIIICLFILILLAIFLHPVDGQTPRNSPHPVATVITDAAGRYHFEAFPCPGCTPTVTTQP